MYQGSHFPDSPTWGSMPTILHSGGGCRSGRRFQRARYRVIISGGRTCISIAGVEGQDQDEEEEEEGDEEEVGGGRTRGERKKRKWKRRIKVWWWCWGGIIPTRDHNFLLGRGDNDGNVDSKCCDTIFGPDARITPTAVEVLCLICNKRGGGGDYLRMIPDLHLKLDLDLERYPSTRFCFVEPFLSLLIQGCGIKMRIELGNGSW